MAARPPPASGARGSVQGSPEAVTRFGGAAHPWAVLGEQLAAGTGQSGGRAVLDVDRSGVGGGPDVFAGGADGQVGEVIAVEVVEEDPSGQGGPEQVTRLGGPDHPWAVLGEGLVAADQPGVGAVHDVDRSGVGGCAQVLKGGADGQIRGAGVEEPGCQGRPELVAGLGGAADPGPLDQG